MNGDKWLLMGLEKKATRIWKDAYPMYIIMEVPTAIWLLQFTNLKGLAILGYLSHTKKSGEILTIWKSTIRIPFY